MPQQQITRRNFTKLGASIIGLTATAPIVAACSSPSAKLTGKASSATLTMAIIGDVNTMDVQLSTLDALRHTVRSTVFDTLTHVTPDLKVHPAMAESWTVSPDGRTVDFTLRQNVKFHNGTPFTADDVVFTVNRIKDPKTGSPYASQLSTVASVVATGKYSVRFHLTAPTPALFTNLIFVPIYNEAATANIAKTPIGTGPFKFVEWVPGDHITVEKFGSYYIPGKPQVGQIVFQVVPDAQTRLTDLQAGSIQLVDGLAAQYVSQVKGFPNSYVIASGPINLYEQFTINNLKPPVNDVRVRQAISYAFDRRTYVKQFWYGSAVPTDNPVGPPMPSFIPGSDSKYTYDLKKAESLLAAAGYSKSHPLELEVINPGGYPTLHSMSILLQNTLNGIGHKVTVRDVELASWINTVVKTTEWQVSTNVYNTVPEDPGGMFNSDNLAPSFNENRFNFSGYSNLVTQAATENNPAKRTGLYQNLQQLILKDVPFVVVDHAPLLLGASKHLQGMVLGPSGIYDYSGVTLSS